MRAGVPGFGGVFPEFSRGLTGAAVLGPRNEQGRACLRFEQVLGHVTSLNDMAKEYWLVGTREGWLPGSLSLPLSAGTVWT